MPTREEIEVYSLDLGNSYHGLQCDIMEVRRGLADPVSVTYHHCTGEAFWGVKHPHRSHQHVCRRHLPRGWRVENEFQLVKEG